MAILLQTHWAPESGCMSDVQEWNSQTPPSDPFINERASVNPTGSSAMELALQREQLPQYSTATRNVQHTSMSVLFRSSVDAPKSAGRHAARRHSAEKSSATVQSSNSGGTGWNLKITHIPRGCSGLSESLWLLISPNPTRRFRAAQADHPSSFALTTKPQNNPTRFVSLLTGSIAQADTSRSRVTSYEQENPSIALRAVPTLQPSRPPSRAVKMAIITRAVSITNFLVASSALCFQVFVLYPWHKELDENFEKLKKEHIRVLDNIKDLSEAGVEKDRAIGASVTRQKTLREYLGI
ncbi:hypothetical protein LA080_009843 [Diaporthe eres]|nr:hypothetical protein LA080_009843 [Diaporthe eres]